MVGVASVDVDIFTGTDPFVPELFSVELVVSEVISTYLMVLL